MNPPTRWDLTVAAHNGRVRQMNNPDPNRLERLSAEQWLRLRANLLPHARRCTSGDEHAAEDLVQAAIVQALAVLPANVRSIRAWLRTVVTNEARRSWEIQSRSAVERDWEQDSQSESGGPPAQVRSFEETVHVLRFLETLPPKYRQPLDLRYLGGWSIPEIATALGIADAAVRQQLKRGLNQLRSRSTQLKGFAPDGIIAGPSPRGSPAREPPVDDAPLGDNDH